MRGNTRQFEKYHSVCRQIAWWGSYARRMVFNARIDIVARKIQTISLSADSAGAVIIILPYTSHTECGESGGHVFYYNIILLNNI